MFVPPNLLAITLDMLSFVGICCVFCGNKDGRFPLKRTYLNPWEIAKLGHPSLMSRIYTLVVLEKVILFKTANFECPPSISVRSVHISLSLYIFNMCILIYIYIHMVEGARVYTCTYKYEKTIKQILYTYWDAPLPRNSGK